MKHRQQHSIFAVEGYNITIAYDAMWEGAMQLAHRIGKEISRLSPDTRVKRFNISKTNKNDIMTEVFKSKAIVVGSPTVDQNILSSVGGWLDFLKELKVKNKKAAVFGCYGWSGESRADRLCGFPPSLHIRERSNQPKEILNYVKAQKEPPCNRNGCRGVSIW